MHATPWSTGPLDGGGRPGGSGAPTAAGGTRAPTPCPFTAAGDDRRRPARDGALAGAAGLAVRAPPAAPARRPRAVGPFALLRRRVGVGRGRVARRRRHAAGSRAGARPHRRDRRRGGLTGPRARSRLRAATSSREIVESR